MPRKTSEKLLPDTLDPTAEQLTAPETMAEDEAPSDEIAENTPLPDIDEPNAESPSAMDPYEFKGEDPLEPAAVPLPLNLVESPPHLSSEAEPEKQPAAKAAKPRTAKPKEKKTAKTAKSEQSDTDTQKPVSARRAFYNLDFRTLDRDLSPEQEQEWNSIYASYRAGSILTGTVVGVDEHTFDITDEQGKTQRRTVQSLVIIGYRVKVVIPETEIWAVGEENSRHATRSMVGAKVDYVIMNVDRENDCAIASRRMAMTKRRRHFSPSRIGSELVKCNVILTAQKVLLVNCGGFDLILTQKDLCYTAIADLRTEYKPGQELTARLLDMKDGKPVISVKEVNPNPFDGAELRHPVGCRRQAEIEGKYAGGVFCRLLDNTTCLCLYSNNHYDTEFYIGDTVLIHITEFDYNRKLIYGRIVSKR